MRLLFPVLALPLLIPAASIAKAPAPDVAAPRTTDVSPQAVPAREMPVINPLARNSLKCPPTSRYEAAKRGGKLDLKKLNELPAADAYKAVLRSIDGCNAPIIVGYGIGGREP